MSLFKKEHLSDKTPVAIGYFKDHLSLESTLNDLKELGLKPENIAILAHSHIYEKDAKHKLSIEEVASTGVAAGLVTGGFLGWLGSIETFFIPRIGLLLAAGPISSALAGVAIGGTIGGLSAAFLNLGVQKVESRKIEQFIKDKGVIVSVHVDDKFLMLEAKNVFVVNGAVKVFPHERETESHERKILGHTMRKVHIDQSMNE